MTKSFNLIIFILLLPLLAASKSLVGTSATYQFKAGEFMGKTRIEIIAYDANAKAYIQKTTTITKDGENVDVETVDESEISSPSQNLEILSLCEDTLGGRLTRVSVIAGTFESCIITESDEYSKESSTKSYFANVPFGMIKIKSREQIVELVSFQETKN